MNAEITYTLDGNVVKIHRLFRDDIVLNRESVKLAISNVKNNRDSYATEEAYRLHLAMYENALAQFITEQ